MVERPKLRKYTYKGIFRKKWLGTLKINTARLWEEKGNMKGPLKQLQLKMLIRIHEKTRTINESFNR